MADKHEFVDLITEATRQVRRRIVRQVEAPEVKEKSRLGHRSKGMADWREATFKPWKLKPWNWKDWD